MYLIVDVGSPKASHNTVVGVGGEEGRASSAIDLVDLLHDDP